MKLEDWLKKVKSCKKSLLFSGAKDLKVVVNPEHTIAKIMPKGTEKPCKCCGHIADSNTEAVYIKFKNPQSLTIFQSELLWGLYIKNILISDYARYHECIAGKEFIESIEGISTLPNSIFSLHILADKMAKISKEMESLKLNFHNNQ